MHLVLTIKKKRKNGLTPFALYIFYNTFYNINETLSYFFLPLGLVLAAPTIMEKGTHNGAVNTAHLMKKKIK